MSSSRPRSYLRARRKALGLSQRELAALLGVSRSAITKAESAARRPPLKLLIVAELLFAEAGADLFPSVYEDVETALRARAAALLADLPGTRSADPFRAFLTNFLTNRSSLEHRLCRQPPLPLP